MRPTLFGLLVGALATPAVSNPAGSCFQPPVTCDNLIIKGSTTLRPITNRVQSLFSTFFPGLNLHLEAAGSTTGIRALIEGACAERGLPVAGCDLNNDGALDELAHIANSSRPMSQTELNKAEANGLCIVEQVVARDGLGIIVSTTNGTNNLAATPEIKTMFEQNMQAFCGGNCTFNDFPNGNSASQVLPVSRTIESGTFGSFIDLYGINRCLLAGAQIEAATPGACPGGVDNPSVCFVGSNDEILAAVAGLPVTCLQGGALVNYPNGIGSGGVGYIGISFQNPVLAKNVAVRKTEPSALPFVVASFGTVQNGTFAFARDLFTYTVGVPQTGDSRAAYLDYVQGPYGQANVFEIGFVPATKYSHLTGIPLTRQPAIASQLVLEPHTEQILRADTDNIARLLSLIASSIAVINDPNASQSELQQAQIDLIESQFGIEELVLADNRLLDNLITRGTDCLSECIGDVNRATVDLAAAQAAYLAAQDVFTSVGCSPVFPVDCNLTAYTGWLAFLEDAFRAADESVAECAGILPSGGAKSREVKLKAPKAAKHAISAACPTVDAN